MPVMSATHASELHSSHHPRSLLQSRSLRDLHGPPPPIPRRRISLLNSPDALQSSGPTTTVGTQPNRRQPLKIPLDVQRQIMAPSTKTSSVPLPSQVSMAVRHTRSIHRRPGDAHHKTHSESSSSHTPSVKGTMHPIIRPHTSPKVQQQCDPPVDLRRARRYGSNFGLEHDRPSLPIIRRPYTSPTVPTVPDNSSLASTPLAMYTEGDTDSDTESIDHSLELSFPQPPPLDDYMRLRRMHSSPMFTLEEADSPKGDAMARYVSLSQASAAGDTAPEYDQWGSFGHLLDETGLSLDYGESPKRSRQAVAQVAIANPPLTRHKKEKTLPSSQISVHLSLSQANDAARKRATAMPTKREQQERVDGIPLTHTRSLSRFRTDSDAAHTSIRRNNSKREPAQLPLELSASMDRLDLSMRKLRAHGFQEHTAEIPATPPLPLSSMPIPPSLASAGRKKPARRPHLSAPPTSLKFDIVNNIAPTPRATETSLHYHKALSQAPARCAFTEVEQLPPPKSFIDITPEHNQRPSSRDKMRRLLTRASMSLLRPFSRGKGGSK